MLAKVKSSGLVGLTGHIIDVEADVSMGLPAFEVVGLPDAAVKESKERVRAAIKNCNYDFPSRRYTVNLAPANLKKEGPAFDLPIAIGILSATEQLRASTEGYVFIGELSLSGDIRTVKGVLPLVMSAVKDGYNKFIVPTGNAAEAAMVEGASVYGVKNLFEACEFLEGRQEITFETVDLDELFHTKQVYPFDFSEVKGQENVKRALEIAAAGSHNCLIIGSPGSGKTMLAQRIPSILPDLTLEEALEVTKIHSVAGMLKENSPLVTVRPFRNPHHSISTIGLVGGGSVPKPGELSLSHCGVLFLDELPEFRRDATEVMRQPIEDGVINITRVAASISYPCKMMLVAAMNPCKCGYYGDRTKKCHCSEASVQRYLGKVSGPLLDRIDIQTEAASVMYADMQKIAPESSEDIKKRVIMARNIQTERYKGECFFSNADLCGASIEKYCVLDNDAKRLIRNAFESMGLSARAHSRILKVSRTIADLDGADIINELHIAEAIQYRSLDKKFWK